MKNNEKVTIGWIDGGTIFSGFAAHVSQLLLNRADRIEGVAVASGPYLSQNRNKMVDVFLETDSDWLLSIDTDLLITLESFDALIESADSEKYPVVAGKYYLPFDNGKSIVVSAQTSTDLANTDVMGHWVTPEMLAHGPLLTNLHSVGIGYCLIHREVFEAVQALNAGKKYVWFKDEWREDWNAWVSDDIGFFNQLRVLGINISLNTLATSTHLKNLKLNDDTYLTFNVGVHEESHANTLMNPQHKISWWAKRKKNL
jgi:hypothetical protein